MEKHFTATVVLVTDSSPKKVLLGLHKKLGVWLPPGGHIEPNETPVDAAIRETMEETGIDISSYLSSEPIDDRVIRYPVPSYFFEEHIPAHGTASDHKHLDFVFVIYGIREVAYTRNKKEMDEMRWFTKEEILGSNMPFPIYANLRDRILKDIFQ